MSTPSKNFSYAVESEVAVITFDMEGEPVNTIAPQISQEFESLMTRAAADSSAKAIVFISGKKDTFIAGAKIDFLQTIKTAAEASSLSRQGQAGFDRLDALDKPVVAAIHGACLGGGHCYARDHRAGRTPAVLAVRAHDRGDSRDPRLPPSPNE